MTREIDGTLRPATEQEILNRGAVVDYIDPATGDVFLQWGRLDPPAPGEAPGEALTPVEGPRAYLAERRAALPEEHRPKYHHAVVYRARDGSNLREECATTAGGHLPARTPAIGRRTGAPPDLAAARAVLEEARRRAAPTLGAGALASATPAAVRLRIPMAAVRLGDVVEEDVLVGRRFAGERDI